MISRRLVDRLVAHRRVRAEGDHHVEARRLRPIRSWIVRNSSPTGAVRVASGTISSTRLPASTSGASAAATIVRTSDLVGVRKLGLQSDRLYEVMCRRILIAGK